MTTVKIIIISFFLLIVLGCNNQQRKKRVRDYSKSEPSVSHIDGHYAIDTAMILENQNLAHLLDELNESELIEKKTVPEIPPTIRAFLDSLTGSFLIASQGEEWRKGCTDFGKQVQKKVYDGKTGHTLIQVSFDNSQPLPFRQLNYFGLGKNIALMKYYAGGIAKIEHILIFRFHNNHIVDFWSGTGGVLNDEAKKQEIITFLKANMGKKWGLNTNMIYL